MTGQGSGPLTGPDNPEEPDSGQVSEAVRLLPRTARRPSDSSDQSGDRSNSNQLVEGTEFMSTTKQERNARILELLTEIAVDDRDREADAKRVSDLAAADISRSLLPERQHPWEV